jgi:hypothetical protein
MVVISLAVAGTDAPPPPDALLARHCRRSNPSGSRARDRRRSGAALERKNLERCAFHFETTIHCETSGFFSFAQNNTFISSWLWHLGCIP